MTPFLPSFIFSLLFFLSSPLHVYSSQDLIQTTCKACSNGDPNIDLTFCTTSLRAAPASGCAMLRGLGKISLRLVANNVTDTKCYIKNLINSTKRLDPFVKQCLSDCLHLYSDAIASVRQAISYYNYSRLFDANVQISSIMDAAATCEDGFKDKKGVVSPLTKRNNDTFQLSAVSLSLMHILQARTGSLISGKVQ